MQLFISFSLFVTDSYYRYSFSLSVTLFLVTVYTKYRFTNWMESVSILAKIDVKMTYQQVTWDEWKLNISICTFFILPQVLINLFLFYKKPHKPARYMFSSLKLINHFLRRKVCTSTSIRRYSCTLWLCTCNAFKAFGTPITPHFIIWFSPTFRH